MDTLERMQMDEGVCGGRVFGRCNLEDERILEFTVAHNQVALNSFFMQMGELSGNISTW